MYENMEDVDENTFTFVRCIFNGVQKAVMPKIGKSPVFGEGRNFIKIF
jgi:hypothetical protein